MLSKAQRKKLKSEYGHSIYNRCTGKTTAASLELIGWCIKHPGSAAKIWDHHNTRKASEHMLERIANIVEQLGLIAFTYDRKELTVTFDAKREYV